MERISVRSPAARRPLPVLAAVCLLLLLAARPAAAAVPPSVILRMDGHEETVRLIRSKNLWTLMLPSSASPQAMTGAGGAVLPDMAGVSGTEDSKIGLTVSGRQTKLQILPSGNVGTVFVTLDRLTLSQFGSSKRRSDTGACRVYDAEGRLSAEGALSGFSLHGNSTLKAKKKSFNLKFAEKQAPLGMDADRSWALISNAYDNSFARNYTALTLAELLGMPFVPEQRPVDVYLNGQYLGVYLLCEKVQIGKGRVEIRDLEEETEDLNTEPLETYKMLGSKTPVKGQGKYYDIPNEPDDITGGYLMELDLEARYHLLTSAYVTERGQIISIRSPKYVSKAQYAYISALLQSMENAMYSEDGADPVSGRRFEEIVDLDSAALKYMFEELVCNFDANKTSQFFYKDSDRSDPLIHFGPPWDYDISLANRSGEDGIEFIDPDALAVGVQVRMKLPVYYRQLYSLPTVRERLKSLSAERGLREAAEALTRGGGGVPTVMEWTERCASAIRKNYMVNPHRFFAYYTRAFGGDFRLHAQSVSDFLARRAEYLAALWENGPETTE